LLRCPAGGLPEQATPADSSNDDIALHVSQVSPPEGSDGEAGGHSGYTPEQ
jgi:hypothetical protein